VFINACAADSDTFYIGKEEEKARKKKEFIDVFLIELLQKKSERKHLFVVRISFLCDSFNNC
jgi:hypothetical protein